MVTGRGKRTLAVHTYKNLLWIGMGKHFMLFHPLTFSQDAFRSSVKTERRVFQSLRRLCYQPWILLPRPDLPLQLPSPNGPHPLHRNLYLTVCPVSGDLSAITTFQRSPGGSKGTTKQYATYVKNGWHFVVNGKLIVIHHQWEKLFNFSWGYLIKGLATQFLIPLALPYLYHWYDRRGGGKLWFATI